jgi:hypothetical protein
VRRVRGWPDDGTGTEVPEADVEALIAWGRFTDAGEALLQLERALPGLERGADHGALRCGRELAWTRVRSAPP